MNTIEMVAPAPMNEAALWQAVLTRDTAADGTFVYAVASTGIYCRPICPGRRPKPSGVTFFNSPAQAERAGYRACFRCKPQNVVSPSGAWLSACRNFLDRNADRNVTLDELARFAGVTPTHLQRAFQRAFGLSPRAYQTAQRTRELGVRLGGSRSVTDAMYGAGFNSAGSAYSWAQSLGVRPAALRKHAAQENIVFTIVTTQVGKLLAAATAKGLCRVAFADTSASLSTELQSFREAFCRARICALSKACARDTHTAAAIVLQRAVPALQALASGEQAEKIPVDLRGTAFQQKVWKALRQIPRGQTRSYSQVAEKLGQPAATRAVARACATNPIALAIPCHRVNAVSGALAGYRWGVERKRRLQVAERSGR